MLNVQPAWPHVNSAEPASCHGDVAAPLSGTHPLGLSHWAVKRTDIADFEPSPASWARAPSWVGEQTLTCAHDWATCALAVPAPTPAKATQVAIAIRVLRSIRAELGRRQ